MKLGIIARADNRGLGAQTWEAVRHLDPAKVLVVDMGEHTPYEMHLERFPGATVLPFLPDRDLTEDLLGFLEGLDVVWSAETPYWNELLPYARALRIKTVICANLEFHRWLTDKHMPLPDLFQAPSSWHLDRWPANTIHLPFPVARDRLPFKRRTSVNTFLHIAGHRAHQDRAGSRLVLAACRYLESNIRLIVRSQSAFGHSPFQPPRRNVELVVEARDVENYWDIYDDADVMIQPRRYGGQSLPLNEAQSLGLPIIALDRPPENELLPAASLVRARRSRRMKVQSGEVDWYDTHPRLIAQRIDELVNDDALVERLSKEADIYADSISWETLKPRYVEMFESLL